MWSQLIRFARFAFPFGSKKYCVLFILISGRLVLWKPGRGGASGLCLFMWGRCRALWCTDPVQHPSEQLASCGTEPSVLTGSAWSVTVHYAPIRWSEKSNTFLSPRLLWRPGTDSNLSQVVALSCLWLRLTCSLHGHGLDMVYRLMLKPAESNI